MINTPDLEESVFENFLKLFPLEQLDNKNVGIYWPIGSELDCSLIIEHLLKNKITICFPKVEIDTKVLSFYVWEGKNNMISGNAGTLHPETSGKLAIVPDLLIVPIIAFDRSCNRLGRGGGYYDATIALLRRQNKSLIVAGLAFDTQLCLFPLPCETHDEKMDLIITPTTIYNSN